MPILMVEGASNITFLVLADVGSDNKMAEYGLHRLHMARDTLTFLLWVNGQVHSIGALRSVVPVGPEMMIWET